MTTTSQIDNILAWLTAVSDKLQRQLDEVLEQIEAKGNDHYDRRN
jgi:hypothetical protein